ncbi:glutamine--fructose-6-phosphate transaminase (isomerizing) [bacterium AH-315-O15]|nr:glutamine--fructose-6-phosphate transaminase (isomerizing) [bacterium AH-315-O15]
MCGIIGYIGSKPVVPVLLDGLRRMEYRGYDSAGVAVVGPDGISLRRSAGKLVNLESAIRAQPVDGLYGVGHTRWATHGRPTEENAHPHSDCTGRIVVVHNGIIENYLDLKRELQSQGHDFKTETDTEIVAHLVEREIQGDGLEHAVRRALTFLRGMFALVLVSLEDREKIVAVRNGPPLVVGLGDDEFFVASDIPAVLSHTRDVVFLGDEEIAVLTRSGVAFTDYGGREVSKTTQQVTWDPIAAEKGGHRHFMLKEIYEQPSAARDTILGRVSLDRGRIFLEALNISDDTFRTLEKVSIVACGTSWHAGLVGKYLIEALAQLPVEVDYGSEYRYRNPIVAAKELTIVITQSGETADTLAALREARRKGASSIAICNVVGSMATREADGTVYTHAGPEIGVASTKAFTSQLVALHLLALHIAQLRGSLVEEDVRRHIEELLRIPQILEQAVKASRATEKVAERFYNRTDFLFLGRGINYPIALEGALKLKEVSYIHAEGYPAGEMKHGPIALIDERMPVVAIAPNDHVFGKMVASVQEAKARGASVIAITTDGDARMAEVLDASDVVLSMPATTALLTPIVMTIPLQLLAYHIAVRRGCDVDQPRNLAKSVTVE